MNDTSPEEPRFDQPPASTTRQVTPSDWSPTEIEPQPEVPPPRERLFPRKVLIGWALLALVVYFGVRIVSTVVKESVKQAVITAAQKSDTREIIYRTPNGRITISRNKPNGSITISRSQPETPPTGTPPTGTPPAPTKR
ncbi:MAG TPA: hypothetical protein VGJ64_01300 [Gemmatimonadaceae bacterium]|jgi:hypothetical protein